MKFNRKFKDTIVSKVLVKTGTIHYQDTENKVTMVINGFHVAGLLGLILALIAHL